MSRRDSDLPLHQMHESCPGSDKLSEGKSSEELVDDRVLGLAIVRLMEIVGEAANRVPKEEQSRHPEIPWTQIIGLRNRLIHGYDTVDLDALWDTITDDLPPLIAQLQELSARGH